MALVSFFSLTAAAKWESGFVLVYGPAATWATSSTGATGVSCSGYIYFRYFENGGWSHYAIGGDPPYPCGGAGVAIAQRERSWKTKLVTTDSVRVAFSGMGFLFEPLGFAPRDMLTGATGPTDIVSTGDDHWAVAFVDANKSVQVRDLVDGAGGGFRSPIVFTPPLPANDHVVGGAAIAYDGTRLVLVWPRTTGNRAFRYAVATYSAGATQATVIASGDVPAVAGYVSEFQASASLSYDGSGLFYLAVIHRSGITGLTNDALHLFTSASGSTWTPMAFDASIPHTFTTAEVVQARIAGNANGDVALGMISDRIPGRLWLRRSGVWTEVPGLFSVTPDRGFALVRWTFLSAVSGLARYPLPAQPLPIAPSQPASPTPLPPVPVPNSQPPRPLPPRPPGR